MSALAAPLLDRPRLQPFDHRTQLGGDLGVVDRYVFAAVALIDRELVLVGVRPVPAQG
jgi:hypothetical protein